MLTENTILGGATSEAKAPLDIGNAADRVSNLNLELRNAIGRLDDALAQLDGPQKEGDGKADGGARPVESGYRFRIHGQLNESEALVTELRGLVERLCSSIG